LLARLKRKTPWHPSQAFQLYQRALGASAGRWAGAGRWCWALVLAARIKVNKYFC